ncbi:MAG: N-acetylmuramoyl-L-alanine amidase [Kiritimatiellae bacterium]|nr:N-acetylmuramoyl-L-alanine amidase [Kiritimatiellia bacterium]MBR5587543.1 N-acetylmuramoyl-L-alanine amidase [Kiritimatiellia bacterium]
MKTFLSCFGLAMLFALAGCNSAYRTTARELGIYDADRIIEGHEVTLKTSRKLPIQTLQFTIGQRPALIDGVSYYLNKPAGYRDLSSEDIQMLRKALLTPVHKKAKLNILVDPGHGGSDSGCRSASGTVHEQVITLAIAREVQAQLKAMGHHANLTRPDEKTTRTLDERTLLGASLGIDAFVSIHVNASANPEAKGVETYTLPAFGCEGTLPNSPPRGPLVGHAYLPPSTRLAYYVQKALLDTTQPPPYPQPADRGVRHAHFKVLRDTPAPSILIEIGFMTNAEDFARITDATAQKEIARRIVQGIVRAF